jgi:hypothetical protein
MRILTRNMIEENSSIAMTNPDGNYPVANIYANMLEDITQASAASSVITVTWAADISVDSFFLGYHNLSSITVVFKDSGGGVLSTTVIAFPGTEVKQYITELTTVRSVEISLVSAVSAAFLGGFSCGNYTQLHNVGKPIKIEHKDTSLFAQTDGGQVLFNTGIRLRGFPIAMNKLTEVQADAFIATYDYVHKGKGFWLDRHEDTTKKPMYAIFDSDISESEINEFTDLAISVMEAR